MTDMLYPGSPAKEGDPGYKSPTTRSVVDRVRSRALPAGTLGQINEYRP